MTFTIGSLFSGIGGLELGLEASGMEVLWQVENNTYCQSILAKHWPHAKRYGDVRDVGRHNLAPVNVVCGGFPCQDISYAGKGAGLTGTKSGLWYEYARIIGEMGPDYAVVENVPALLTRGLDQVLGTLADLGYDAEWRTLSAADAGAPHLRKRLFIVAYANRERRRPLLRGGNEEQGSQTARSSESMGDPARGRCEQHYEGLGSDSESGAGHLPLVDAEGGGRRERREQPARRTDGRRPELGDSAERRSRQVRDWRDAAPVRGADGTIRLIPKEAAEAGPQSPLWPVADGIPGRVARLSAIGNAVVPPVALQVGHWIQRLEATR